MAYRRDFDEIGFVEDAARGGLSIAELARRHDVSRKHAAKLLAGRNRPQVAEWIRRRREDLRDTVRPRLAELRDAAIATLMAALAPAEQVPPSEGGQEPPAGKAAAGAAAGTRAGRKRAAAEHPSGWKPGKEAIAVAKDALNHLLGERWLSEPTPAEPGPIPGAWIDRLSSRTRQVLLRNLRGGRSSGGGPGQRPTTRHGDV